MTNEMFARTGSPERHHGLEESLMWHWPNLLVGMKEQDKEAYSAILAKQREIFPRTAGNTGNSLEILGIPGKYWEFPGNTGISWEIPEHELMYPCIQLFSGLTQGNKLSFTALLTSNCLDDLFI